MNAWHQRRRTNRALRKAREAQDRLHGRRASTIRPVTRQGSSGDGIGEIVVDVLLALPRGALWILSKILD